MVAHTMRGLCAALAYLHGERKIHRDVKVSWIVRGCGVAWQLAVAPCQLRNLT